ncbi:hypothetical protein Dimus_009079 [Dionaea muscipula]
MQENMQFDVPTMGTYRMFRPCEDATAQGPWNALASRQRQHLSTSFSISRGRRLGLTNNDAHRLDSWNPNFCLIDIDGSLITFMHLNPLIFSRFIGNRGFSRYWNVPEFSSNHEIRTVLNFAHD